MGIGQGLFAALILLGQSPWLLVAGIAGNLAIVGMYIVEPDVGHPARAPHRGRRARQGDRPGHHGG